MATERAYPASRRLAAPSLLDWPLNGTERLRVTVHCMDAGTVVTVSGRQWRAADGEVVPFAHDVDLPLIGSTVVEVPLQAGVLLSVFATRNNTSANTLGETFVRVEIIQGVGAAATVLGALLQGYINSVNPLGWPGSPLGNQQSGFGVQRLAAQTTQAVPMGLLWTVPAGFTWRFGMGRAVFRASAVAGNRTVFIFLRNALSDVVWALPTTAAIVANEVLGVNWSPGFTGINVAVAQNVNIAIPEMLLEPGYTFSIEALGTQVGDTLTDGISEVRQYFNLP